MRRWTIPWDDIPTLINRIIFTPCVNTFSESPTSGSLQRSTVPAQSGVVLTVPVLQQPRFSIKDLPGEALVVDEYTQRAGVVLGRAAPEGLGHVPPPHDRVALARDHARRGDVIGVQVTRRVVADAGRAVGVAALRKSTLVSTRRCCEVHQCLYSRST